jgi:putative oxidoreductase
MTLPMKLGLALFRVVIGALLFGHGTQKLFGWFGGYGPDGTGQFFESIGIKPGKRHAVTAGASEAVGGALIATGLLTPVGTSLVTGTMVQAIKTVHAPKGPWVSEGGWEYNAVIIASLAALTDVGPGDWSLDRILGTELSGPFWTIVSLAAGVAGPTLFVKQDETAGEVPEAQAQEAPTAGAPA